MQTHLEGASSHPRAKPTEPRGGVIGLLSGICGVWVRSQLPKAASKAASNPLVLRRVETLLISKVDSGPKACVEAQIQRGTKRPLPLPLMGRVFAGNCWGGLFQRNLMQLEFSQCTRFQNLTGNREISFNTSDASGPRSVKF